MSRFNCTILNCTTTPPLGTQPIAEGWAYVPHGGVTIGAGWYCPTHAVALALGYHQPPNDAAGVQAPMKLRVGRSTRRTLWMQHPDRAETLIGLIDTPELATALVEAVNRPAPPAWERYTISVGDDSSQAFCLDCGEAIGRWYDNGTQITMYITAITAHDAEHL